ncbi:MAG: hypothetical protein AB1410_07260 [Acidobacteriota bacterium]
MKVSKNLFVHYYLRFLVLGWVLLLAGQTFAQGKFSGYMFGDYYYVFNHHNINLEGQNGFWFRRIYFTYDYKLTDEFFTRFRLELNSPGDFKTNDTLKPYVKDAYLGWKTGNHNVIIGISPTPTWEFIEAFWGYRSVEKTPLDLYRMGDSRDFGFAFKGSMGKEKWFSYHIQVANGEGTKSEVNKQKKGMASFLFKIGKHFLFEIYGDYSQVTSDRNSWVYQGFFGYRGERTRIGVQYAYQTLQQGIGNEILNLSVSSVFGIFKTSDKTSLLFRYDRMADPNPSGQSIAYVPINGGTPFSLFLAGLDLHPIKNASLIPNIELISYDKPPNSGHKTDFYLKVTFFYSWSQ